jgi:DnaB helicase-like protein
MRLDLTNELERHLLVPDNALRLRSLGVSPELLFDNEQRAKGLLEFVLIYIEETGRPPTQAVLRDEYGELSELPPETEPAYLVDRLKVRYAEARRKDIVRELGAEKDPDEFRTKLLDHGQDLWRLTATNDYAVSSDDYRVMLDQIQQNIALGRHKGITYGFPEVDLHTGGARRTHLTFLAASPKRFKTWVLLKAFIEQRRQGETPVFFTLELSQEEIWQRIMAMLSGVSFVRLTRGEMSKSDWAWVDRCLNEFKDLGPAHVIASPYDKRTVNDIVLEAKQRGATSVLIDQLSYLHGTGKQYRQDEVYREIVHNLKQTANKENVPFYVACQLNRTASGQDEITAQMTGLTRAIEETCDTLLGLVRTEEMMCENWVQLRVVEARHCESGPNARWSIHHELSSRTAFTIQ